MTGVVVLAPIMLALSLFVETSSWWIRAQARPGAVGLYVSRSNIYLYGGRFFSLAFTTLTAYWIEKGASPAQVATILAGSLAFSAIFQQILLSVRPVVKLLVRMVVFVLRLPPPDFHFRSSNHRVSWSLFFATAASAFIFGLGTGMPLLAAVLVPEFRLSVSNIGQIINSFGTLVILLMVDQKLFASLDRHTLPDDVWDYGLGRIAGFIAAAVCFGSIGLLLPHA